MGKIGLIFFVVLGSGTFISLRKPKSNRKSNDIRIYNCTMKSWGTHGENHDHAEIPMGPKD